MAGLNFQETRKFQVGLLDSRREQANHPHPATRKFQVGLLDSRREQANHPHPATRKFQVGLLDSRTEQANHPHPATRKFQVGLLDSRRKQANHPHPATRKFQVGLLDSRTEQANHPHPATRKFQVGLLDSRRKQANHPHPATRKFQVGVLDSRREQANHPHPATRKFQPKQPLTPFEEQSSLPPRVLLALPRLLRHQIKQALKQTEWSSFIRERAEWNMKKILAFLLVYVMVFTLSFLYYTRRKEKSPLVLDIDYYDNTSIWTSQPSARLGNKMGEYATLYALAKLNHRRAYVLPKMYNELSNIFNIKLPVIAQEVADGIKWKRYNVHDWMSPEYSNISDQYVQLGGTPCSWTFYHHLREEILREFTIREPLKQQANKYLSNLRGDRKHVTFVGVHVRRGDYVTVMPKKWKGVIADKRYLKTAMDYFRNKYENPLFVVTSNGMDWCKENINNSLGDVHFAGDGQEHSPARDFSLLAHCNHTIMTVGTFGYWAGYLTGGETIYLTNFTLPDSPFLKVFKYEAAFLPEWIGIPADLSPLLGTQKTR
ncbi:galactoside alpha-(1,2)-fucosyltransferase 2-like [Mixophyes fleayi]|uniref:galactoside alpha-(1,2)-fucosyltransferase 2-like n=1 Tax=Mixophyes fleayi TaxID=3061075 RepID=UPI003F4E33DC